MKFTKEEAVKELSARLSTSVKDITKWSRTITENVETLFTILGEDSEVELNDFADKAMPLLNTAAGLVRHENAELAKMYEKKIADLNNPSPTTPTTPPTTPATDPVIAELQKKLKELEDKENQRSREQRDADTRKSLSDRLKEIGVNNKEWINAILPEITITDGFDVNAKADQLLKLYNVSNGSANPSVTPNQPTGGTDNYASSVLKAAGQIVKQGSLAG